jgi:hypothetical protein
MGRSMGRKSPGSMRRGRAAVVLAACIIWTRHMGELALAVRLRCDRGLGRKATEFWRCRDTLRSRGH